jgi:hypothetical protein
MEIRANKLEGKFIRKGFSHRILNTQFIAIKFIKHVFHNYEELR